MHAVTQAGGRIGMQACRQPRTNAGRQAGRKAERQAGRKAERHASRKADQRSGRWAVKGLQLEKQEIKQAKTNA